MILRRLQLFSLCTLAALSLIASPVSACVCAHHAAEQTSGPHHEHLHSHSAVPTGPGHGAGADRAPCAAAGDACTCAEAAPSARAKAESVKIEKDRAAVPIVFTHRPRAAASVDVPPAFALEALPVHGVSLASIPARGPPRP